HSIYPNNLLYQEFIKELEVALKEVDTGFELYNHSVDDTVEVKNCWHPIHIRKPMLEVFRGTQTAEEQDKIFIKNVMMILPMITDSVTFQKLRKEFEKKLIG
ncbi:MAG: hypothetical protein J7604_18685, partial [Sporocytophaga sp.]|uniref:hypothetical protein n=1 Tax=Sporocytophaga sp. TaxID=2231183 RepID=UPI001B127937